MLCNKLEKDLSTQTSVKDFIKDSVNKLKGDLFEIFAELFFTAFPNDPEIGVIDYRPILLNDDYGVDALGKNVNGDACAIQMKFRTNPIDIIDYDSIAKTYASAKIQLGLSLENDDTIFLLTTGAGISGPCEKVFARKLRTINRGAIAYKVDNNMSFWQYCEDRIFETLQPE